MAVGRQLTRQNIDGAMEQLALVTFASTRQIQDLASWAASTPQEVLEATPYSYTADEAFAILSAVQRLQAAGTWLAGGAVPAEVHDTLSDLAKFQGLGTAANG